MDGGDEKARANGRKSQEGSFGGAGWGGARALVNSRDGKRRGCLRRGELPVTGGIQAESRPREVRQEHQPGESLSR